ncbi:hypothetical protein [Coxiella endosymbiont of Dermacentor marginatus]|uniref:hypothetical protein n=1 Tax=Coxiella endosymbiont of Dermacentor marginatus TaxID=1656159 RepID=UPI002223C3EA|nr:hypothetical protein [Coxiella endosymbiont of Dermacentor marginatus]
MLAVGAIFFPLFLYNPHSVVNLSMVTTVPKAPDKPEVQLQFSEPLDLKEKSILLIPNQS